VKNDVEFGSVRAGIVEQVRAGSGVVSDACAHHD
jgi:hypothetical protein